MNITCAFLIAAAFLTGCQANTFTHKQFRERIAAVRGIAVPPGQVHTAVLNKLAADEPFVPLPEESEIRREMTCAIVDELLRRGFVVAEIPAGPAILAPTNQMWGPRAQMVYFDVPFDMPRPEAGTIAKNVGVEAVVYFNVSAFKSTSRRETLGTATDVLAVLAAFGGSSSGPWVTLRQAVVQITLVDANDGSVLWVSGGDFRSFETVKPARAVAQLFERFPRYLRKEHP